MPESDDDWLMPNVRYTVCVIAHGVHTWFPAVDSWEAFVPVAAHIENELRAGM